MLAAAETAAATETVAAIQDGRVDRNGHGQATATTVGGWDLAIPSRAACCGQTLAGFLIWWKNMTRFISTCSVVLVCLASIVSRNACASGAVHPLQQALLNLTLTVTSEPVQDIEITGSKPGTTD